MKALAVFHGHSEHPLARFLKEGFRHCFVALAVGDYWVVIDPKGGVPEVTVPAGTDFDLGSFYREEGLSVAEVETGTEYPVWPFAHANCVGVVKYVLGIKNPMIVTPYQLWKSLQ